MKKIRGVFFVGIVIIIIGGACCYYYYYYSKQALPSFVNTHIYTYKTNKKYVIKKAGQIIDSADTLEEAKTKAKDISRSIVINTYNNEWVYCDLQPYFIITDNAIHDFSNFYEAYVYARKNDYTTIYHENNENIVWKSDETLTGVKLDVPTILQLPELPRGCEVTSLAMLLRYRGITVDKMTLAAQIKKDTTAYSKDANGRIYYGNPYDGFVGDMYNAHRNGYGVYHEPIAELAKQYSDNKVIDLTGAQFEDVLFFVQQGNPAWVITNSSFSPLQDSSFEIWHTPTGIVKTTKKLHSVVITGFNENSIFINDPLVNQKNRVINRNNFKLAWEQMGNQAVIIIE